MNNSYREEEIKVKLKKAGFLPLDVMVTGVTGAGKSTTLNSLFKKEVATVGIGVDPETMDLESYRFNDYMRFWDTPGLGDCVDKDIEHSKKLINLLNKIYYIDEVKYGFIDTSLIIIEGSNRDMGTVYKLLNEVILKNFHKKRVLIAINQADMAMKGRHWDFEKNMPSEKLKLFLDQKVESIQKRVKEATGLVIIKPIYYSAEYGYNISKLYDLIVDNMPIERRDILNENNG